MRVPTGEEIERALKGLKLEPPPGLEDEMLKSKLAVATVEATIEMISEGGDPAKCIAVVLGMGLIAGMSIQRDRDGRRIPSGLAN